LFLSDSSDQTFKSLTLNLRSSNTFLRKYSLSILNSFFLKAFIADFADLQANGELDDEHDFSRTKNDDEKQSSSLNHGHCSLLETLIQIESLLPTLDNERQLTSAIRRVEVLGGTRLPIEYAEVAIHHMFGILHIKVQPFWPVAIT
jgi:hypothetical protein